MSVFIIITSVTFIVLVLITLIFETELLVQIFGHLFPKVISSLLVISLALIAFVFGIHSEIFSSHDKYNSEIKNSYNWFNPEHVFKFPIEQYGINKNYNNIPETQISLDSILPNTQDTRRMIIVVDKTASIVSKEKYINEINQVLKKYVEDNNPIQNSNNSVFDNLRTEDLFLLTALDKISKNKTKTFVEILFYTGDTNYVSPKTDGLLNNDNIGLLYEECIKMMLSINYDKSINNAHTDFYFLLNKIASPAFTSPLREEQANTSLILLSDFAHEEKETGNSFESLKYKLQNLEEKVNQINLIKFKGKGDKKEEASRTINLFRKKFNHLYYYEFDDALTEKPELTDKSFPFQISRMFSYSFDVKNTRPITFYHSWNLESYRYDYNSKVAFLQEKDNKFNLGYGYSRNSVRSGEYSYLLKNKKNKIYAFEYSNHVIQKDEKMNLSFLTNKTESKDYFLEIYNMSQASIARIPIIFKPVLPITSCIALVFIYVFFGISVTSLVVYYFMMMFHFGTNFVRMKNVLWIALVVCTLLFVSVYVVTFSYVYNFISYGFNLTYLMLFTSVVLLFYFALMRYSRLIEVNKYENGKFKKIENTILEEFPDKLKVK